MLGNVEDDIKIFVTNPISVGEFRQTWLQILPDVAINPDSECTAEVSEGSLDLSPVAENLKDELMEVCSENTLKCDDEPDNYTYISRRLSTSDDPVPVFHNIPNKFNLVTLSLQREEIEKRWTDVKHTRAVADRRKRRYNNEATLLQACCKTTNVVEAVDPTDVVLTITICEPSRSYTKKSLKIGGTKYEVLGSQMLTELRDKFSCVSDLMIPGDFSHNPDAPKDIKAKDLYKSGFFFINNTFYNDMRDPLSRDYSKVIIDWMNADSSRRQNSYQTKKMEETTFLDLEIQLGHPYVYTHQGNCEHLLIFNDLKMVNPDGCMDRTKYPLLVMIKKRRSKKCMLCHVISARWITRKNDRLHLDPFLFCDECFRNFNYDDAGEKVGEFIVHPFIDKTAII